jgi:hypothetical protein
MEIMKKKPSRNENINKSSKNHSDRDTIRQKEENQRWRKRSRGYFMEIITLGKNECL